MKKNILRRFFLMTIPFLFASHSLAAENSIDRLFFTPKERASLDQGRLKFGKNSPAAPSQPEQQAADQITLDGFVRHSSGKITAWVNQMPQRGQENVQGIKMLQTGGNQPAVSMQLPSGKKLDLKAGQTFDMTKGTVTEVYEEAGASPPRNPSR